MPAHVYYVAFAAFAVAYWFIMSQKRASFADATSSMRAGEIVAKLGMTLVEGDPSFHFFADATPSMGAAGALLSGTPFPYQGPTTEIRAAGVIEGRATELYFHAKATAGVRLPGVGRDIEVERTCRLSLTPFAAVPDFELVLRRPNAGAEPERVHPALAQVTFGNPRLDDRYALFASDPHIAARLARAASVLDDQTYVHVVGERGRMSMPFTLRTMYLLGATPQAFLQKLDALARALEG